MSTAFKAADILLPKNTDMKKWAVVACDQYTSEPKYWAETDRIVGETPSALRVTLPEVYLEEKDVEQRIEKIHSAMAEYVSGGVFEEYKNALVYVERRQGEGRHSRCGGSGAV